jgi:hypothetical protein
MTIQVFPPLKSIRKHFRSARDSQRGKFGEGVCWNARNGRMNGKALALDQPSRAPNPGPAESGGSRLRICLSRLRMAEIRKQHRPRFNTGHGSGGKQEGSLVF